MDTLLFLLVYTIGADVGLFCAIGTVIFYKYYYKDFYNYLAGEEYA